MQQPMTGAGGDQASRLRTGSFLNNLFHNQYFKIILTVVKLLVGLALLVISIRGIGWQNLVAGIRSANLAWLAVAIGFVLLGLFLKLWRWMTFIRNYQVPSSISRAFSAYFIGQAVNIILPFRGGELVRLGYFSGDPQAIPKVASTIAFEKYLDLLALTFCGILVSFKFSLDNIFNLRGLFLPLTSLLTLLLLVIILFGPAAWQKIRSGKLLPRGTVDWMDHWVQTSLWLRNPRQVIPGILLTVLIWAVMWLTNLILLMSIHLPLGVTAAGLVLILVYVGLLPALMPGNIGPFYFFASLALVPFGIAHDQAFVYAVVLHAIVTIPPLLGGIVGLSLRSGRVVTS